MKKEDFDLEGFIELLHVFESQTGEAIQEDLDYAGEADDLLEVVHRLHEELVDLEDAEFDQKKFNQLLPDILFVMQSLQALDGLNDEGSDDDELELVDFDEDEDDEEFDEEDEDDEEFDDEDEDDEDDEEFNEFRKLQDELIEDFETSAQFETLSEDEQESSAFVLDAFCEYISLIGSPDILEWNRKMVREVCLEKFPEKVVAEPELFNQVVPILTAFFQYLYEVHEVLLAPELEKYIKSIEAEIPIAAANQSLWGGEKQFAIEAMEADVDLEDPEQLQDFIERFNTKLMLEKSAKS